MSLETNRQDAQRWAKEKDLFQYRYWLHHGSGEMKIPSYARFLSREMRNYRPFYMELVSCIAAGKDGQASPVLSAELPRPDSVYSFRVGDSLWLNMPLA